jgi:nucleotide-binding universal stress UspA family protein
MIRSVLVPLQGLASDTEALATARDVVGQTGYLDCLHVRPDPRLLVVGTTAGMETGLGAGVFPAELWTAITQADQRRAKAAREHFDTFCKRFDITKDGEGVTAGFREIEGDPARDVTTHARYSDLVVLARHALASEVAWDATGDVLIGCGRPVMLVPKKTEASFLATVAIAWKETAEAARAVTAAMPILTKAKSIVVLAAREGSAKTEDALRSAERLAGLLRRHGLTVRAEHVPAEAKSVPDAVTDRALALQCGLLVMGAYGHGRMRELIFGGFTRHVLAEPRLPILLAH